MNDDNLLPFMDKENQSGNVLRPRERLGSVPESPGTMEGSSKSYSYMMKRKMTDSEINSILDGGEKRLAVIDPNQPRTSRKRLAQKVLSSPLQIISGRKKASVKAVNIEVDGKRKDRNDDRKIVLNESQRKQAFAGKMKGLVSKLDIEREFDIFVKTINEVQVNDESKIFDSCPEVVSKIKKFLATYILLDKTLFSKHLCVDVKALLLFLKGQNQERCDNPTYKSAYLFFEKLRIYNGESKSAARCFNESNRSDGFRCTKEVFKKEIDKVFIGVEGKYEFC